MTTPTNIASSMAPPFSMVSKYFIASVASFVVLCLLLVLNFADIQGHHFQPKLLALTHIATLGWISMIIFGAMFQLLPVVLEVKLFSTRLGEIQFWMYCVGIIGMVYGFWYFKVGAFLTVSASLVTLSMLLFSFNVAMTMARVTRWNLTGLYLLAALVYLMFTALAGLLLSINLGYPFISRIHFDYLKIHAHAGFIGWVVMVIMGVGLKLIPMFGLSHGFSTTPAKITLVFVNFGLMGVTIEWLLAGPEWLLSTYIAVLVMGVLCFLLQLFLIFKHRMRRFLDLGMKHSVVAFTYFFLSTTLGTVIAFSELGSAETKEVTVLAYGFVVVVGFFSMLIMGQMYKIVPFLVWFHTFSDKAGKESVPMLKDMFNERVGNIEFWIVNTSIVTIIVGLLGSLELVLFIGFNLLLAAALMFAYNIGMVFRLRMRYGNKGTNS